MRKNRVLVLLVLLVLLFAFLLGCGSSQSNSGGSGLTIPAPGPVVTAIPVYHMTDLSSLPIASVFCAENNVLKLDINSVERTIFQESTTLSAISGSPGVSKSNEVLCLEQGNIQLHPSKYEIPDEEGVWGPRKWLRYEIDFPYEGKTCGIREGNNSGIVRLFYSAGACM